MGASSRKGLPLRQSVTRSDERSMMMPPSSSPSSRSKSPLRKQTLSISGFVFSIMILFINLQLHRALTASTTDRYSGLRRVAQVESGEVDQLWANGKELGLQLKDVARSLEQLKEQLTHMHEEEDQDLERYMEEVSGS